MIYNYLLDLVKNLKPKNHILILAYITSRRQLLKVICLSLIIGLYVFTSQVKFVVDSYYSKYLHQRLL